MIDEYIGSADDPIKNRDGLVELLGDKSFVIPAIQIANAHRGKTSRRQAWKEK